MPTVPPRDAELPLVLALDLGSSSLRAIIYDRLGREVEGTEGRTPSRWRETPDGGVEADPDALVEGTFAAIDQALAGAGRASAEIRAVGISTFWHNIMAVDRDGRPLTPLYSWADERSAGAAEYLRGRLDEEAVRRRTGVVFHPSYPASRLLWLRDAVPDAYRSARAWLSIGEYLTLRCFGTTACSISMASGSGLLDQRRCVWDAELLEILGLSPDRLSRLVDLDQPFVGPVPPLAARWPALARVPWLPAAGDGALSNLGTGCATAARAALVVGTSGAIRILRLPPDPRVAALWRDTLPRGLWSYRADRARVLHGGAISNGGNVYRWMHERLALGGPAEVEQALRTRPPAAHGLIVLPYLSGERSPDWPLAVRGAVVGMTQTTDSLDLLQASLEAVAYRLGLVWDLLRAAVPEVREIVASGGALRHSAAWVQIIADALGHEVILSSEDEGSSRGAALVALEVLGTGRAEDAPAPLGPVAHPDPGRHALHKAARARHRCVEETLGPLQPFTGP